MYTSSTNHQHHGQVCVFVDLDDPVDLRCVAGSMVLVGSLDHFAGTIVLL